METKIISIDISPETTETQTENAGVMWEHNATSLVFNIHNTYIGDYRYYLEYRSLIGTKVRTEYLELNTETKTVTYNIPVTMSSLKGVECYFNIISIDGDGNTVQVIKPHKFCLQFDYSPDTDNSLAKVNDFSVNALLEAIRLGTFKGDKGEKGDTGSKGDKGDKGETGEVSMDYATSNFASVIKKTVTGNPVNLDDASAIPHTLDIKTAAGAKVHIRGKNLIPFTNKKYNGKYQAGQSYEVNGVNFTFNDDGSVYAKGTSTNAVVLPLAFCSNYMKGIHTVTLSGSPEGASATTYCLRLKNGTEATSNYEDYGNGKTVNNVDLSGCSVYIIVISGQTIDDTFYPMLEFGDTANDFVSPCESVSATADENGVVNKVKSVAPKMSVFTNTNDTVECNYNCDTLTTINKAKEDVTQELNKVKEDITNLGYRLINAVTLDSDIQLKDFSTDIDGNSIENKSLRKIFILFMGRFVNTTPTQPLCLLFNGGSAYQMYKTFSITENAYYGFWIESEKIISVSGKAVHKSTYPSTLLGNFNAETEVSQGLSANNSALYSDLSIEPIGNIKKITFGCFNGNNLMKSGSKIYLFGV